MGRSRGSSPSGRSVSRSAPARPAPAPAHHAPPQTSLARPAAPVSGPPAVSSGGGGGLMSGIGSTIVQGMAFGTGSAIAHRAVGAVAGAFGGGSDKPEAVAAPAPVASAAPTYAAPACTDELSIFNRCLTDYGNDLASCQWQFDTLKACQSQRL